MLRRWLSTGAIRRSPSPVSRYTSARATDPRPLAQRNTLAGVGLDCRLVASASVLGGFLCAVDEATLEKMGTAGCERIFKEKRSGVDAGRPELKRCLEYLREGDTLLVTKLDRLARSTSDLYRIVSQLGEKGVAFKVTDDPSIDATSRTGKLVMGVLALIAEFENDIRRERQMDGINKAKKLGVKFGRKRELTPEKVAEIRELRADRATMPEIMRRTGFSKASVYRALSGSVQQFGSPSRSPRSSRTGCGSRR
jgi:DNA invertase Pin-like site-specific DNA recombinase